VTELSDADCRAIADVFVLSLRTSYRGILESGATPEVARAMMMKGAKDEGLISPDLMERLFREVMKEEKP
jgi:hypothetical protein